MRFTAAIFLFAHMLLVAATPLSAEPAGDTLEVVGFRPVAQDLRAAPRAPVAILFSKPIDRSSIDAGSFWAFGRWSGTATGTFVFYLQDRLVLLRPDQPFARGERVMVMISGDVRATDGTPLREAGYSWQYWTRALPNQAPFVELASMTTRTVPGESSRAYGGTGTDLDNDGWLDLTIVNEDTADLRVFLNKADGTGMFNEFIQPPTQVNARASPNEPSDFNRDGNADLAVANINTDSISVVLGNGDGTFAPQQEIVVGDQPRGIAVLDADGDGDVDIVNTNSGGPAPLSLLVNDGNGVFAEPVFFGNPFRRDWALAAADMNGDGIMDLVSATQDFSDPAMSVYTGNGDGTFSLASTLNPGGAIWMVTTGDMNGDGFEDVVGVANNSNTGVLLLGDGEGALSAPQSIPTDPFPLATDVGDTDGDGDLDWITSSFSGDWLLFANDGAGGFGPPTRIPAPIAASCALILDIDNDGDNDLALVDEIADVITLYSH